jgi:sugar-specific transcriptional regulator TrmB
MKTEILEDLGLTKSEISIYLSLLEIGSSCAGDVLKKSKLQNSVVHRALNSLIEKGLINYVIEGKRKLYTATDPENFNKYIEDKKERFLEILPELKKKQISSKEIKNATIYHGRRGIKEVYYKLINLKNAEEYNTFGGGVDVANFLGIEWWNLLHKKRVLNKLSSRQIFDLTVKPLAGNIESNSITKIKYLPANFAQFQETVIVGEYVAINVFSNEGYSFLIKDKKVADGYRKYFEALWKIAK